MHHNFSMQFLQNCKKSHHGRIIPTSYFLPFGVSWLDLESVSFSRALCLSAIRQSHQSPEFPGKWFFGFPFPFRSSPKGGGETDGIFREQLSEFYSVS